MMKFLWILSLIVLAGCQSAPVPMAVNPDAPAVPPPKPEPSRHETDLEARLQQQRYVIDALLSQQEAIQDHGRNTTIPVSVQRQPLREIPAHPVAAPAAPEKFLQPDGSGLIDLAALAARPLDAGSTNPFVVAPAPAPVREVVLSVQGVLPGPAPSAIVNDRPLEIGDAVDSLRLTRIDPDGVVFVAGEQLLKIPLGLSVRVRLP